MHWGMSDSGVLPGTGSVMLNRPLNRGFTVLSRTAVYRKVPEGYVAFVEELPSANTQGATLPEARANLREAVELVIQASRELSEKELRGADVIREPLEISA
jgi:predicted RNase H-like HicB family nuclease